MSEATEAAVARERDSRVILGFWIYLMTDIVLFASLFATYAVLHNNTFGGPSGKDIFELPFVLVETIILLTSSFTVGLAMLAAQRGSRRQALLWFAATFVLGATFLGLELGEFSTLVREGHSWQASGFLTSFFTLVGTHGAHITVGLLWMLVTMGQIVRSGLSAGNLRRITLMGMFWHFLDVIWIFIFTVVYLMGVL